MELGRQNGASAKPCAYPQQKVFAAG